MEIDEYIASFPLQYLRIMNNDGKPGSRKDDPVLIGKTLKRRVLASHNNQLKHYVITIFLPVTNYNVQFKT